MKLSDITFDPALISWETAGDAAARLIRGTPSSADTAITLRLSQELLRVLIIVAAQNGHRNMSSVRHLIERETKYPDIVLKSIDLPMHPKARAIVRSAREARGSWFCEPILFLDCNVTDEGAASFTNGRF